jgi:hypothetical protein
VKTTNSITTGVSGGPLLAIGRNDGVIRIYCEKNNGTDLYEFTYSGGNWTPVLVATAPQTNIPWLGMAIGPGRNDLVNRLYEANGDGNTYEYTFSGTWQLTNTITNLAAIAVGCGRNDGTNRVYGIREVNGVYKELYELEWNGSGWTQTLVGSWSGGPEGGFIGGTIAEGRGPGWNNLYVTSSDGYFYEFSYDPFSGWSGLIINNGTQGPNDGRYGCGYGVLQFGKVRSDGKNRGYVGGCGTYSNDNKAHVYEFGCCSMIGTWEKQEIGTPGWIGCGVAIGDARGDSKDRVYVTTGDGKLVEFWCQ